MAFVRFFSQAVPGTIANAGNTGNLEFGATLTDASKLTTSDYNVSVTDVAFTDAVSPVGAPGGVAAPAAVTTALRIAAETARRVRVGMASDSGVSFWSGWAPLELVAE